VNGRMRKSWTKFQGLGYVRRRDETWMGRWKRWFEPCWIKWGMSSSVVGMAVVLLIGGEEDVQ